MQKGQWAEEWGGRMMGWDNGWGEKMSGVEFTYCREGGRGGRVVGIG